VRRFFSALLLPGRDVLAGLELCLERHLARLGLVGGGLLVGWWLYVPLHELLHAAACWATGGTVQRLEIDRLYLGELWARILPFVVGSSHYAGRLSGFDPHGSDFVRLATDLGPFLLTLWPGVWALRWEARRGRAFAFGLWLTPALAPFLSLTGDAYEIGAILVTRLPPWSTPSTLALLRGDDLGLRIDALSAATHAPWGGLVLAACCGLVWALATYALGSAVAHLLGQPALPLSAPGRDRAL
jgi:hypothetical protein